MLNIKAKEHHLHTETTYFFSKLKIPSDLLTFRDQLDLNKIKDEGKLRLTLVDHNVLTGQDHVLDDCVVSVFDHHVNERLESERYVCRLFF